MALADAHHLALATVSGDVDLSTAQGRLVARMKGTVAAHEIEHMKARQRRAGTAERRTQGTQLGQSIRLPRGYPPARPGHRAAGQTGVCGDPGGRLAR